jgi:hypothetical protein
MQGIKKMLGTWALKKEYALNQRAISYNSLHDAKTIALVFEAGSDEEIELVKKYMAYLREMGKSVKALAYFDQKQVPQIDYSKQELALFGRKDLTFYLRPTPSVVSEFVQEPFDLLIDLNIRQHLPLFFVSAHSKAKCKVGVRSKWNEKILDMMIDIQPGEGIKILLKQIDTYLLSIKKAS